MIFIKIRSVPAAFREETPFTGVPALLRSDIVALLNTRLQLLTNNFCLHHIITLLCPLTAVM